MKRKDALWVMQMCRDRDARSEAEREAFDTAIEALQTDIVRCEDCKFNKKCTLQHYWTVDGFTEEIEYCSLGKRSGE